MSLLLPLYLAGLLGLAVPLILHRFSEHNPPEQPFPASRFLVPAKPPVSRKKRLRYRILFALRALLLIALCLLFAQPWLNRPGPAGDGERIHLVVLDQSFSMRLGNRWSTALSQVKDVLAQISVDDVSQLFTLDDRLIARTGLDTNSTTILDAIRTLEPGYTRADYGQLMQRLNTIAAEFDKPVSVTLITDAQRSSLPAKIKTLLAHRVSQFTIKNVSEIDDVNYFLSANARTVDGVHVRLAVTVGASSSADNTTFDIKELVVAQDGRVLARESVSLKKGETETVFFDNVSLTSSPDNDLNVSFVSHDKLPDDDSVNVIVRGTDPVNVALAAIGVPLPVNSPVFVATALETDGLARVKYAPSGKSALPTNAQHVVLFAQISNTAEVPQEAIRFVENGGNALVVHTPQLPVTNGTAANKPSLIGRVEEAHPLTLGEINWYPIELYDLFQVSPQRNDRVLLETVSHRPLLIERAMDGGRLLLLTDPLDGIVSDFPLQPAFIELLHNIVRFFDANSAIPEQLLAGQSLSLPAQVQVLSPAGNALLKLDETSSAQDRRLDKPGLYTIIGAFGDQQVAVALDNKESNITGMTVDEIQGWEKKHNKPENSYKDTNTAGSTPDNGNGSDSANNRIHRLLLWHYLLPIAIILLFMETLFANRHLGIRRDGS